MKIALIQMASSDDPEGNLARVNAMVSQAAAEGAGFVLTPEITNCLCADRSRQRAILQPEESDFFLAAMRDLAREKAIFLLLGSLALKSDTDPDRLVNRSFLIGPDGSIIARYDKTHMFDVDLGSGESYRESAAYAPGNRLVLATTPFAQIGMSVCYDLRFPAMFRSLAQAGAQILTIPAAFAVPTGRAHWEVLVRARAIENGCFVLAPAQSGRHAQQNGALRETWGHSLVVAPWGEVLADGGEGEKIIHAEIDLAQVAEARQRVPSLRHDRLLGGP